MNNVDGEVHFSESDSTMQFLLDDQLSWEHSMSTCLPSYAEQPQNPPAYPHFSSLPSPTTAEQFAPHPSYGSLHTPTATAPVDFCVAPNPGPWSSSSLTHNNNYAPISQLQNQYQNQIPHGLLCGRSRDLEPLPVPPTSIPSLPLPLPPTLQVTHSYSNAGQYDAWMCHILDEVTCTSSPDGDTGLSASDFLGTFANYEFPLDACADPQPSITLTHNIIPPAQSQHAAFPPNEPICNSDRPTRIFKCRWLTNGAPCGSCVMADRRSVVEHLQYDHGIKPGEEKARETCLWEQCRTVLNKESLARHILTVHLKERVHCDDCGLSFAREDSLKRHLKGGQHNVPADKNGMARQPPSRNHAGLR